MVKRLFIVSALSLLSILPLSLSGCCSTSGSVGAESFAEMLTAPAMAVTASSPGWLLEKKDIHSLSAAQVVRVKEILQAGELREVSERYYRSASEGNRGDSTDAIFYLYASNAQCLGGRIIEDKVLMDDLNLSEEAERELYTLLHPQLKKLFPDLP